MSTRQSPMTAGAALDLYFLDNRARLLEIAAFLDRLDRYQGSEAIRDDYRYRSFHDALKTVLTASTDRTATIQQLFSDTTADPVDKIDNPRAFGAWKGYGHARH